MAKKKTPPRNDFRVLFLLCISSFLLGMIVMGLPNKVSEYIKYKKFQECTGHKEGNVHYHATLSIYYLGEEMKIPPGIGLEGDCIHPVHTHDETNLIHVDYPSQYPFTVGDFFKTWGYIFNKRQFANIRTFDGYRIRMEVNGRKEKALDKYVIGDKDKISIYIEKN